jgi:hypothetical protein
LYLAPEHMLYVQVSREAGAAAVIETSHPAM